MGAGPACVCVRVCVRVCVSVCMFGLEDENAVLELEFDGAVEPRDLEALVENEVEKLPHTE